MPTQDPIAAAAVDAAASARHRVRAHFCALHAISPADAIEYVPPGPRERRQFEKLWNTGVIRQTVPGYYWLDLDRMGREEIRRDRAKAPLAIALAILAALIILTLYPR